MKRLLTLFSAAMLLSTASFTANAAAAKPVAAMKMPELTIYHLENRRSERIVWLMEELEMPYKLVFVRGDLGASMAKIKAINPGMPVAPTITLGNQVMVESGAIIELILNRYAPGKLQPKMDSPEYADWLTFMHYAEGSLASHLFMDYRAWRTAAPTERSRLVDSENVVQFAEDYLKTHPWFGGSEFSSADIMMMFPLNVATSLNIVDVAQFPNVAAWKAKVEARPAYKRMLAKARPDGMVGALPKLPAHAPSGPRKQ
jgi:glutathione S-transferase